MKKIYIHSCHAALEYDQAIMFADLGFEVSGIFDVGSTQRPKVVGVTDKDRPGTVHERAKNNTMTARDVEGADIVVVHQTEDFPEKSEAYAKVKKGIKVVQMIFGQGSKGHHERMVEVLKKNKNVVVVAYSAKDYNTYNAFGAPLDQLYGIRFACDKTWGPWKGHDCTCLVVGNDIHERGDGCGWPILEQLLAMNLPLKVVGNNTENVKCGIGLQSFDELKERYRMARVCLCLGTIPAPYTMSLMEAVCSGTPVLAYDNGYGIADEGLDVHTVANIEEAKAAIMLAIEDEKNRKALHATSMRARKHFDYKTIMEKWEKLFSDIS